MDSNALQTIHIEELDTTLRTLFQREKLYHLYRQWTYVKEVFQNYPALIANVTELETLILKLSEPPLSYAIFLGVSPNDERALIVGVGASRLEVHAAEALTQQLKDLKPGQVVVLNEKQNVVAIRQEYSIGETAEVINIIAPDGEARVLNVIPGEPMQIEVTWREGEHSTIQCSGELQQRGVHPGDSVRVVQGEQHQICAYPRAYPRLHVKSGSSEGTIVEISHRLYEQDVKIGDIVRIEPGLKIAFEKLPSYETGELTLEEVPDVTYDDIGGLDEQIEQIYDAIELPYLYREEFSEYQLSRPKGILLYGPPGCGKTMVAKAVANSLTQNIRHHLIHLEQHMTLLQDLQLDPARPDLVARYARLFPAGKALAPDGLALQRGVAGEELTQFLSLHDIQSDQLTEKLAEFRAVLGRKDGVRSFFLNIKGPELLDKYVGETEHRIRKIFEEARRHATYYTPVVIFFDEMEAMFRTRGSGRSSDVETTIVPQFLSEIDGVESAANLVIIGASNRQDMIDPAILRPKRLDVKIKVDRPTSKAAQDIFAMYLLPTLPLNPQGLTIVPAEDHVGEVVFRTAYTRSDQAQGHVLPPGCDFRLALSLQPADVQALATFPATTTIRDVLALEGEGGLQLSWNQLRRLKPSMTASELLQRLRDLPAHALLADLVHREWVAEAIILETVALLYSVASMMHILTGPGNHYTFSLKDFMSGAIIANIVDRAKRQAIKRLVTGQRTAQLGRGIGVQDLLQAVQQEFEENKEQLAMHKLNTDLGKLEDVQYVEIHLKTREIDPWNEDKLRLYKAK